MAQRPNVLLTITDQQNAKVLSHESHPDIKTPNLDQLAAEEVRFEKAITQKPICTTCVTTQVNMHTNRATELNLAPS